MTMMMAEPMTQAQVAPGPAICAAFQAPNNQPEPIIEPRPVNIRAHAPTSRRIEELLDIPLLVFGGRSVRRPIPARKIGPCWQNLNLNALVCSSSGRGSVTRFRQA